MKPPTIPQVRSIKTAQQPSEAGSSTPELTPPISDETGSNPSVDGEEYDLPLPPSTVIPTEVLDIDLRTPDAHVPRDPRLIRLTGIHPFNVEAPLTSLFDEGFLTSPELFFVRNHGPVPEVKDDDIPAWEFSVEGLVDNPFTLSLNKLMTDYHHITRPITLVCAGNRRKEQNVVRQSKGFNWGAAGLSTGLFTGVNMADVIKAAVPKRNARYVCMEGADVLPNGNYGTSVKLNWVLNLNRGFMLAWKMNGEMLRLDHGRPLRVVIPGMIGGRSVKWLKRLILTDRPSENWYHVYDNRVLPTMVSPEEASNNVGWWKDERYAIYDLNVNSAIVFPSHGERVEMNNADDTYRARGYAYTGGGRRVTRVEISLDKGRTWKLADIESAEDRYQDVQTDLCGGRLDMSGGESSFCWCFWSIKILRSEMADAEDVVVRAMDESMNIQPRDMYWSVLGMMNNPWYRAVIQREGNVLMFEHPTQPATMPGGWMERMKKEGRDISDGFWGGKQQSQSSTIVYSEPKEIAKVKPELENIITLEELYQHTGHDKPWFVIDGEVYDGTTYLDEHPGGAVSITSVAGSDATEEFMAIHSETAKAMMRDYHIGTLDGRERDALSRDTGETSQIVKPDTFLSPKTWSRAVLQGKRTVSWNTRIFTFKLDHPEQRLGVPVGQHILVRLRRSDSSDTLIRSYTPISAPNETGSVDLLVKVYFADEDAKWGRMSRAIETMAIGDRIDMKGPFGKFEYLGSGKCRVGNNEKTVKTFVLICGGSGITPIYQVFRAMMSDPEDNTRCVLFDGNRMAGDILCREELDCLAKGNGMKCKIIHTLTEASEDWDGLRGRIDAKLVVEYCVRDENALMLICGPEDMERDLHAGLLREGWKEEQLMFF